MTDTTTEVHTATSPGTTVQVSPAETVPVTDHGTVRMVIGALALYLLAVLVAQVVLTLKDRTLPDSVLATGAVALGALGSMLTSVRAVKS
jgi:hypothetical protein